MRRSDQLALGTIASAGVAVSGAALASVAFAVAVLPPMVADASPQRSRSVVMGSFVGVASLAGLLVPASFGAIIDLAGAGTGGYGAALIASGLFVVITAPAACVLSSRNRTDAISEY